MAWTAPKTWIAGEVVSASDLNAHIRDNELYLLQERPVAQVTRANTSYTTSSLSFVDTDAANLILTLNMKGTRALIQVTMGLGCNNITGTWAAADVIVDSTTRTGDASYGLASVGQNGNTTVSFIAYFSGLTVASHTFKLQWRAGVAATTVNNQTFSASVPTPTYTITMKGWEV